MTLTTAQKKETYIELYISRVETLSRYVEEGNRTSRDIVSELDDIARSLREINNL